LLVAALILVLNGHFAKTGPINERKDLVRIAILFIKLKMQEINKRQGKKKKGMFWIISPKKEASFGQKSECAPTPFPCTCLI